jgi:hypothetical protein
MRHLISDDGLNSFAAKNPCLERPLVYSCHAAVKKTKIGNHTAAELFRILEITIAACTAGRHRARKGNKNRSQAWLVYGVSNRHATPACKFQKVSI